MKKVYLGMALQAFITAFMDSMGWITITPIQQLVAAIAILIFALVVKE